MLLKCELFTVFIISYLTLDVKCVAHYPAIPDEILKYDLIFMSHAQITTIP